MIPGLGDVVENSGMAAVTMSFPNDFLNILEAPNNEAMYKLAIELGSRGTLQTLTLAAMPIDEFIDSVKK